MTREEAKSKAVKYLNIFAGAENVPENVKEHFIELAADMGLNPFRREIYLLAYRDGKASTEATIDARRTDSNAPEVIKYTYTIITGYEVYLKRAERSGKLDGWECKLSEDNSMCKTIIYRKDWNHPFVWTTYYGEVAKPTKIWQEMPLFMFRKNNIEQAMRLAFPCDVGGLPYGAEEIGLKEIPEPDEDIDETLEENLDGYMG